MAHIVARVDGLATVEEFKVVVRVTLLKTLILIVELVHYILCDRNWYFCQHWMLSRLFRHLTSHKLPFPLLQLLRLCQVASFITQPLHFFSRLHILLNSHRFLILCQDERLLLLPLFILLLLLFLLQLILISLSLSWSWSVVMIVVATIVVVDHIDKLLWITATTHISTWL